MDFNKASFEVYFPPLFCRQLGLNQMVPVPLIPALNDPCHTRPRADKNILSEVHEKLDLMIKKAPLLTPFDSSGSTHAFDKWWDRTWQRISANESASDVLARLQPAYIDLSGKFPFLLLFMFSTYFSISPTCCFHVD